MFLKKGARKKFTVYAFFTIDNLKLSTKGGKGIIPFAQDIV